MSIKLITINSKSYLGKLNVSDTTITLVKSLKVSKVNENSLAEYLRQKNLKQLRTITFGGNDISYGETDLTIEEKLIYKSLKMRMKQAKATATILTINQTFEDLLGK